MGRRLPFIDGCDGRCALSNLDLKPLLYFLLFSYNTVISSLVTINETTMMYNKIVGIWREKDRPINRKLYLSALLQCRLFLVSLTIHLGVVKEDIIYKEFSFLFFFCRNVSIRIFVLLRAIFVFFYHIFGKQE